jgi:O-antigen/teichoic acid export membrane protein
MSAPSRPSLARTTIASAVADALLAVASIVAVPFLVGRLGAERYGIFALITVLAGQLVGLHLGIGWAATRRVAENRGRGLTASATIRAVMLLGLGAAAMVGAAFAVLAATAWTRGFHSSSEALEVAVAAVPSGIVIAGVQPLLQGLYGVLYGEERFGLVVAIRLGHGLVRLAVAVLAVALGGGVIATLWSQAGVDVIAVATLAVMVRPAAAATPAEPPTTGEARALLAMGLPFALAGVFAALLADVEKLAIGWARSVEDFTYYSVPFNAAQRLGVFAVALASVLAPRLSRVAAEEGPAAAAGIARRANRISAGGMALLVAPVIAVAPELLRLWLGPAFAARSTLPARILLVALVPRTLASVAESVLRARARPVTFTMLYAAELPLHLAGVYFLVRAGGIAGAAAAWALRVAADAAAQRRLASRALGASTGSTLEGWGPMMALAVLALACQRLDPVLPAAVRAGAGLLVGGATVLFLLSADDWTVLRRFLGGPPLGPPDRSIP